MVRALSAPLPARISMEQLLSGKNGASGPNVQPLVVLGPKSGPEHVTNQQLEVINRASEIPRRLKIARHRSVQALLPNGKNGANGRDARPPAVEDLE